MPRVIYTKFPVKLTVSVLWCHYGKSIVKNILLQILKNVFNPASCTPWSWSINPKTQTTQNTWALVCIKFAW